eukprot:COSAG01_NODE_3066_length_6646_cov_3.861769_5_plen_72_part_00
MELLFLLRDIETQRPRPAPWPRHVCGADGDASGGGGGIGRKGGVVVGEKTGGPEGTTSRSRMIMIRTLWVG